MASEKLNIEHTFTLPLTEVSGLATRTVAEGIEVLAIGDSSHRLVRVLWTADGPAGGDFEAIDLPAGAGGASQWEAIASDAAGRVYILEERPGAVVVYAAALDTVLARIELDVERGAPVPGWTDDPNSRGEGLLVLGNGHLVVVKEKDPSLLVEFGPEGDEPAGVTVDLLDTSEQVALPERATFVPLAVWTLDRARVEDVSDVAATADGRLYLLSEDSKRIVEVELPLDREGGAAVALGSFKLKGAAHPEGLVLLDGSVPLVASDEKDEDENLFLYEPLPDGD
jgi:uncharacterized protein YjiK